MEVVETGMEEVRVVETDVEEEVVTVVEGVMAAAGVSVLEDMAAAVVVVDIVVEGEEEVVIMEGEEEGVMVEGEGAGMGSMVTLGAR